jgi:sugar phosphate isomerase/epimerase
MKYAIFTVAIPGTDVSEVPAKLKSWGYDGVEWRVTSRPANPQGTNFWQDNRATVEAETLMEEGPRVRELTEAAGLEMPSLALYVNCSELETIKKLFAAAANMGVKAARVTAPGYDGSRSYNELLKEAIAQYEEVAKVSADTGVKTLVEIHMGNIVPSASAALRLLENFDPERVGAILDPGNMMREGFENWQLGCEALGPYLAHVHAKNTRWDPAEVLPGGRALWQAEWATMRSGLVDWLSVMKALKSVGYDGWVSLEDFSTVRPEDERLEDDLVFLRAMEAAASA